MVTAWGNNPQTWSVVLAAVTAVGVVVLFLNLRESRSQRQALEGEIAARMRPWVGLFGFYFERSAEEINFLRPLLKNFGALPALDARLRLRIGPVESSDSEDEIRWTESAVKVLMPSEDGDYKIDMSQYPQFEIWRAAARDMHVHGDFEYGSNGFSRLSSSFAATIEFRGVPGSALAEVNVKWRNTAAT